MFSWRDVVAPAKLNLALHVVGQRQDGRHALESLAVFTRTGDRLTIRPAFRDGFEITGPFAGSLRRETSNLVLKARDLLRSFFPSRSCAPVHIRLEKNLPVASGLGGGSSDAAAALKALAELWELPVKREWMAAQSLKLGADLPMCLAARPLVASGIGERLHFIDQMPPLRLILVNPGKPLATSEVFRGLSRKDNPGLPQLPADSGISGWLSWLRQTRNDLESPARDIAPQIGEALAELEKSGASLVRMSGSGATCFGLFEDETSQQAALERIRSLQPDWFVVKADTDGGAEARREGDH